MERPEAQFLDSGDPAVRDAWADLLARSPQRTPFSTLAYADAVDEVLDFPHRLAGVYNDDQLVAGVLLYEKPLGPYRRVVVPPLTPYTSFLFDPPLRETDINQRRSPLDALLQLLEDHYHALAFNLHPSLQDVRAFQWNNWNVTPRYTHRQQPLSTQEDLLDQVSRGVRRRFNRKGPNYHVARAPGATPALSAFIQEIYARQDHGPPLPAQQYETFVETLQKTSVAHLLAVTPKGSSTPEGVQAVLTDGHTGYAWTGGSKRGPAMTLLLTTAMLKLRKKGVECFDFVGANIPSVAEFKRSFGAPLVCYYRVERQRPELQLMRRLRALL